MTTPEMQQTTLSDLLRPLRAKGWIVLVIVAVAVGTAIGLSLTQTKQYSASASFQFQDESRDLGLVGVQVAPTLTPAQLASAAAQTIDQPEVVGDVKRTLHSPLQSSQLAANVSASVDPNANLVHVQATADTPTGAARLANAFAGSAVALANRSQRAAYAAAVRDLEKQGPPRSDATAMAVFNEELGRLRALASIASPASITSTATPPGSPSSPKPVREAAIAGFLGLLVGLLVVYVWDSIDRRLRSSKDVENQWGYPLLGRVREEALGQIPSTREAARVVDPIDWEQFRILRRNLAFLTASSSGRLIGITSAMPQEGKTTVAGFLAFASAAAGKRTLLLECDLRRPVLGARLGLAERPGVTDFVIDDLAPKDILQVVPFSDPVVADGHSNGSSPGGGKELFRHELVCITAGSPTQHPVEILESPAFDAMLTQVREAYDVVILDTAPLLPVVDALEVIEKCDVVIVCGRATKLTRDEARAGREALDRVPERKVGLVVTGIRPGLEEAAASYYGHYEYAGR